MKSPNSLILAADTTREFGSLALLRDGNLLEELPIHAPDGFSGVFYEHLRRLLDRQAVTAREIICFAVAAGPGSFTGVRVGLAAMQGLAEAAGGKMVLVSNLQVLAWFGTAELRAPLLDARRGQVYSTVLDARGKTILPEMVIGFPDLLARLPRQEIEFIAQDFAPFQGALAGTPFETAKVTIAPRSLATAIGAIAVERLRAGDVQDPADVEANYVRRSDAELLR